MEGCLMLRDGGGGLHSWPFYEKRVQPWEREPSGGLNCAWLYKPKASIKQRLSRVSLTVELQTAGKARKRKKQTGPQGRNSQ